jgi:molybdopterin molybdotransferase
VFDKSAMDGYAVRAADVAAAGTCARIMTGAPIPLGADTVVRAGWTDGGTMKVTIHQAVPLGSAIRRQGSEAARVRVLLTAGTLLGPAQIGLVAAAASWPGWPP